MIPHCSEKTRAGCRLDQKTFYTMYDIYEVKVLLPCEQRLSNKPAAPYLGVVCKDLDSTPCSENNRQGRDD